MTAKDLLVSLKSSLERDASVSDVPTVGFELQYNEHIAIATVEKFIQGKWVSFKVIVQPNGVREDDLVIGA